MRSPPVITETSGLGSPVIVNSSMMISPKLKFSDNRMVYVIFGVRAYAGMMKLNKSVMGNVKFVKAHLPKVEVSKQFQMMCPVSFPQLCVGYKE